MHDTLKDLARAPAHRRYRHGFGLVCAFGGDFVLPQSHAKVVHGRGSRHDEVSGSRAVTRALVHVLDRPHRECPALHRTVMPEWTA